MPPGTEARILVAARVGTTRLIDNLPLTIGSVPGDPTVATSRADGGPARPERAVPTSEVST